MSDSENRTGKTGEHHFSINNYPKSYASTKLEDYRLKDFLDLDEEALEGLTNELFDLCIKHADEATPTTEYKDYEYLTSGWKWSVFKKPGGNAVIKIPAGIFPEVNDPIYLENSEDTYKKIEASYPPELIAKAKFYRDDTNTIEQEFIDGEVDFKVDLHSEDKLLLTNFKIFLEGTMKLVTNYQWLPDYWFTDTEKGVLVRNVILENNTKLFKVIDFAQYIDPSRMYPAKTKRVIERQIERLNELMNAVEDQLSTLLR